jgi:hypothetical protein
MRMLDNMEFYTSYRLQNIVEILKIGRLRRVSMELRLGTQKMHTEIQWGTPVED